jgi:apolipoprotein D and lipocalin family protein
MDAPEGTRLTRRPNPYATAVRGVAIACALIQLGAAPASAQGEGLPALQPLPALDVPTYLGTWYQVALFPNRFQKQCVSDTTATYRRVEEGIEVTNRCWVADGRWDSVTGLARPSASRLAGDRLEPARLEVSFLPRFLRWLPIWGQYWVVMRAADGRFAVVSEPHREYLWVLARSPALTPGDEVEIRSRLVELGFDLARWQAHPHAVAPTSAGSPPSTPSQRPTTPATPSR